MSLIPLLALALLQEPPLAAFSKKYCVDCHGAVKPKGEFRMDTLLSGPATRHVDAWKEVLGHLDARDMPPKKHSVRPAEAEFASAAASLRAALGKAEAELAASRPRATRRLNGGEYANTVRDLFGIAWRPGADFPPDDALHGFATVADGLQLSTTLVEKYLSTAREVLERAIRTGDPPQPRTQRWIWEADRDRDPKARHLGIYNGNAHVTFEKPGGGTRNVYIGGPAVFAEMGVHPTQRAAMEGTYRARIRLVPRSFAAGTVASFSIDGMGRIVAQRDVKVENGKEVVLEAEAYYDRSQEQIKVELIWTNGNHLTWRRRNFKGANDYEANYWFLANHRKENGKWVEWKPSTPEELPFSYFEGPEVEISGPHHDGWPNPKVRVLLGTYAQDGDAAAVFSRLLPGLYRRPARHAEIARLADLVRKEREAGADPVEALKTGLQAALVSPSFLFMVEDSGPKLDDYERATRLAYFLWSSAPDEALLEAARKGDLREAKGRAAQVERLLADPRSEALAAGFARQWLQLDKLATVMPEPKLFPRYDEALRDAMRAETLLAFREVLASDLPATELLDARWAYLNEKLADHYGVPGVDGDVMRKVALPDGRRGGLTSQAAILTLTSEATRTSPVIRGAWILERILNRPPPPPPPNVDGLMPDVSTARSAKEQLLLHRSLPNCAGCHAKIDPWGLALENYDATGAWRDGEPPWEDPSRPLKRKDPYEKFPPIPIDASAVLPDGTRLDGASGLKAHLLSRRDEFVRGLAEKFLIYACGRGPRTADHADVEAIVEATRRGGYRMKSLVQAVVASAAFESR